MKYNQRYDGEGFTVESNKMTRWCCCHCGLVHDLVFVSEDGKDIGVASRQNLRATAARRRGKKKWKRN